VTIGQPSPCHPAPAGRAPLAAGLPVLRRELWPLCAQLHGAGGGRPQGAVSAPGLPPRLSAPLRVPWQRRVHLGRREGRDVSSQYRKGGGGVRVPWQLSINASAFARRTRARAGRSRPRASPTSSPPSTLTSRRTPAPRPAPRAPSQRPAARVKRLEPRAARRGPTCPISTGGRDAACPLSTRGGPRGRERRRFMATARNPHTTRRPPARERETDTCNDKQSQIAERKSTASPLRGARCAGWQAGARQDLIDDVDADGSGCPPPPPPTVPPTARPTVRRGEHL